MMELFGIFLTFMALLIVCSIGLSNIGISGLFIAAVFVYWLTELGQRLGIYLEEKREQHEDYEDEQKD